jgi:hypothetical protein
MDSCITGPECEEDRKLCRARCDEWLPKAFEAINPELAVSVQFDALSPRFIRTFLDCEGVPDFVADMHAETSECLRLSNPFNIASSGTRRTLISTGRDIKDWHTLLHNPHDVDMVELSVFSKDMVKYNGTNIPTSEAWTRLINTHKATNEGKILYMFRGDSEDTWGYAEKRGLISVLNALKLKRIYVPYGYRWQFPTVSEGEQNAWDACIHVKAGSSLVWHSVLYAAIEVRGHDKIGFTIITDW